MYNLGDTLVDRLIVDDITYTAAIGACERATKSWKWPTATKKTGRDGGSRVEGPGGKVLRL